MSTAEVLEKQRAFYLTGATRSVKFRMKNLRLLKNAILNNEQKIYDAIYDLQDSPYIGRFVPDLSDKQYRERICEKYRIIYYVSETNNTIYVRYIYFIKQALNSFFLK